MNAFTKMIASGLVFCIGASPIRDVVAFAAGTSPGPDLVKQQIGQYGVGAKLKLRLADGKKLMGSLVSVGDDGFDLAAKSKESPRHIAYADVIQLKPAKLVYRAKGQVDPLEARRVVLGLGVGKHIMVKTAYEQEFHGFIQSIGSEHFTMQPDHQSTPVQIAYSDVQQVGKNLSKGAQIAIVVGVLAAIVVVVLAIVYHGFTPS